MTYNFSFNVTISRVTENILYPHIDTEFPPLHPILKNTDNGLVKSKISPD